MLIDRSHQSWAIVSAVLVGLSAIAYAIYASSAHVTSGGTIPGLLFGIAGFGMMVYAGLLGARKKVRIWRVGRAQSWMRGHLWLGTLSFPLSLFHAGFTFGGGLAFVLMWLLVIVVASGLLGAYLQHTMPRRLLRDVPMETIFDQIEHVRTQLLAEADTVVAEACGKLEVETVTPGARAAASLERVPTFPGAAKEALLTTERIAAEESAPLRTFYMRDMRPFVQGSAVEHPLADRAHAALMFDKVRALVPSVFHPAIADLENICEEERQLAQQARLQSMLDAWQLVHVPLSIALLVLAIVHIVVALRY